MPAGGLRLQLVSPLAVGADAIGADAIGATAGLEMVAALGRGAAAWVAAGVSEPPPHATRSAGRPSNKSLDPRRLFVLIGMKLRVTVKSMSKFSACLVSLCAMSCNQT